MNDVGEALLQLGRIGIDRGPRSRVAISCERDVCFGGNGRERLHAGGKQSAGLQPLARDRESAVGSLGQVEHFLDLNEKVGAAVIDVTRVIDIALPAERPHDLLMQHLRETENRI